MSGPIEASCQWSLNVGSSLLLLLRGKDVRVRETMGQFTPGASASAGRFMAPEAMKVKIVPASFTSMGKFPVSCVADSASVVRIGNGRRHETQADSEKLDSFFP